MAPMVNAGLLRSRNVAVIARIILGCLVASLLGAIAWGLLAPAEHFLVVAPDRGAALTGESDHQFDSIAIFVCIAALLGLLTAVASWQWRSMRGPLAFLGLLVGSGIGAVVMLYAGEFVARLHYPHVDAPKLDHIVAVAPGAGTMLVLIVQPLVASLGILILASLSPTDDLGASRSESSAHDADSAVAAHAAHS